MTAAHRALTYINRPESCDVSSPTLIRAQLHVLNFEQREHPFSSTILRVDTSSETINPEMTLGDLTTRLIVQAAKRESDLAERERILASQVAAIALVQECPVCDDAWNAHGSERLMSIIFGDQADELVRVKEVGRSQFAPWNAVATKERAKHPLETLTGLSLTFGVLPATLLEEDGAAARIETAMKIGVRGDGRFAKPLYFALHSRSGERTGGTFVETIATRNRKLGSVLRYQV